MEDRRSSGFLVGLGLSLCLAFLAPSPAQADETIPFALRPTLVGELGGETTAVAVGPEAVYAAVGARIQVLERGAQSAILGQSPLLAGRVSDLLVEGRTLYATAGSAGLIALDITSSSDITQLWSVAPDRASERFREVARLDNGLLAILVEDREGDWVAWLVRLIDTADPSRALPQGEIHFAEEVGGIDGLGADLLVRLPQTELRRLEIDAFSGAARTRGRFAGRFSFSRVAGDQVFAASSGPGNTGGLLQIDWSQPEAPHLGTRLEVGRGEVSGIGYAAGRLCALGVASLQTLDLNCYDLDGPAGPLRSAGFELEDGQRRFPIAALEGRAHLAMDGPAVYLALGAEGLQRFEGRSAEAGPQAISQFETKPSDLEVQGDLAFSTSIWTGLEIWDVGQTDAAQRLWVEAGLRCLDLAVDGSRLYCVVVDGIEVRDIADPQSPRFLGKIEELALHGSMQARGGKLYLLQNQRWSVETGRSLLILDPQDPLAPRELARLALPPSATSFAVEGSRLWHARSAHELVHLDLGDPARPRELARHRLPFAWPEIALAGDRLIARSHDAVQVYDVAIEGRLTPLGDPIPSDSAWHFAAGNGRMALTASLIGLRLFDIAGPRRPVEIARWAPEASRSQQGARLVSIDGDRLVAGFGTGTTQTVHALDLSQADQHRHERLLRAAWDLPTDLQSGAGRGFLASGWSGDWILDLRDRAHPAIETWLGAGSGRRPSSGLAPARRLQPAYGGFVVASPFSAYPLSQALPDTPAFDYVPDPGQVMVSGVVIGPQFLVDGGLGFVGWHGVFRGGAGGSSVAGPGMLDILDLGGSNPPQRLGRLELGDSPIDMARGDGGHLYLAGRSLLHVLDTRDPASPSHVGAVTGVFQALALRGRRLWALRSQALEVFDLSDPVMPRYLSSIPLPSPLPEGYEGRLAIGHHGLRSYGAVPLGEAGLLVLDLTRDQPEMIGVWRPGWPVAAVSLDGRQATVALEHGGLLTVDLEVEAGLIMDRLYLPAVWR